MGLAIAIIGGLGTAVAALADPLGIGEGEVFGWLQITGVIIGGLVTLFGLALAMGWLPHPGRSDAAPAEQNTTIVSETAPRDRAP